jgi:hypothetical protein
MPEPTLEAVKAHFEAMRQRGFNGVNKCIELEHLMAELTPAAVTARLAEIIADAGALPELTDRTLFTGTKRDV